jgi:hypothetical protein
VGVIRDVYISIILATFTVIQKYCEGSLHENTEKTVGGLSRETESYEAHLTHAVNPKTNLAAHRHSQLPHSQALPLSHSY